MQTRTKPNTRQSVAAYLNTWNTRRIAIARRGNRHARRAQRAAWAAKVDWSSYDACTD